MNETMSNPTDWAKYYQQNLSGADTSMAVAATSTISPAVINNLPISPSHGSSSSASPSAPLSSSALSPEGRVSKPARRRSRASRRTPTTLLNTDTTNFRAMVQQFTGSPNAPFASAAAPPPHGPGATTFSFSLGAPGMAGSRTHQAHPAHIHNPNPSSVMSSPGYCLQYHHQQQLAQYQNQNHGYMISLTNSVNNNPGAGDGLFFQRLGVGVGGGGNLRPPLSTEVSDAFLMDSSSSQVAVAPARPPSNENRGHGFMF